MPKGNEMQKLNQEDIKRGIRGFINELRDFEKQIDKARKRHRKQFKKTQKQIESPLRRTYGNI